MDWREELKRIVKGRARFDESLAPRTTFRIGGPCDVLLEPSDIHDITQAMLFFKEENIPYFILGLGSNLLIKDSGFRGCAMKITSALKNTTFDNNNFIIESGRKLAAVSIELASRGFAGFENLSGIPGTIGGAIFMNASAFGASISEYLTHVDFIDEKGLLKTLPINELKTAYRKSIFQEHPDWIIISGGFELPHADPGELEARISDCREKRKKTQPAGVATAGSFFKNPEGDSAGALIDKAGLKGMRAGDALVSEVHANFIVNAGGATCSDVLTLSDKIVETVYGQFGVELKTEVRLIG